MNSAIFQRVRELFHAACELPPAERSAYLDSACGDAAVRREVEALLDADSGEQGLLTPAAAPLAEQLIRRSRVDLPPEPMPERIGAYLILDRLGGGGMGEVFAAEQERPRRKVAIKLIRRGMVSESALRRFALEAEVLGRLQHENIARILEAGLDRSAAGERPFLVMEFVDGLPLTRHAEARQLGLRERVALFARVCDGVQHAHQRGVIHRDLKPANILISADGVPKILDFGIARTLDDSANLTFEHSPNAIIGTLAYMSPEQVSGDRDAIDTRTDVYGLGVVLFELLTGSLPQDISALPIAQAARVIVEGPTPKISPARRDLRGDLETIMLKALQRERSRRYGSPAELAADLRHYLAGEPIVARADSSLYVLGRQLRKHRAAAALGTAGLLVLIGSVIALAVSYSRQSALLVESRAARDAEGKARLLAEVESARALAINDFLRDMLISIDPARAAGQDVRMRDYLDQATKQLDAGALANRPEIEASLRTTLGKTYHAIGLVPEAERQLDRALELTAQQYGPDSREAATVLNSLGAIYRGRGEHARAEDVCARVVEIVRRERGTEHHDYAVVIGELADVYRARGKHAQAEPLSRAQIRIFESLGEGETAAAVLARIKLGQSLEGQRKPEAAVAEFESAVELARTKLGREHPYTANALDALGSLLTEQNATAKQGIVALEEALAIRRAVLPSRHPEIANVAQNLAVALETVDADRAIALLEEAIGTYEAVFGESDPRLSGALQNLAYVETTRGRFDAAIAAFERALRINRAVFGSDHPRVASTLQSMGAMLMNQGRLAEAEPLVREALGIRNRLLPPGDPLRLTSLCVLGQIVYKSGRAAEAEPLARACLEDRLNYLPPEHGSIPPARMLLGQVLLELGRLDQAEPLLVDAFNGMRSAPGITVGRRRELIAALGQLYEALDRPEEAARWREASADTQPAE